MSQNISQYESDVWKTADLLIGAGIKQSDFPKFMMPFFALIMVESRLVRYAKELEGEISRTGIDEFIDEFICLNSDDEDEGDEGDEGDGGDDDYPPTTGPSLQKTPVFSLPVYPQHVRSLYSDN